MRNNTKIIVLLVAMYFSCSKQTFAYAANNSNNHQAATAAAIAPAPAPATLEYQVVPAAEALNQTGTNNDAAATPTNATPQATEVTVAEEPKLYPITKLTPVMREQTDPEIVYTLDGAFILPHLANFIVLQNTKNLHEYPVITKHIEENIIGAKGNQVLVTAKKPLRNSTYSVIRKQREFIDPNNNKQSLGVLFTIIGTVKIITKCQDTWKMQISNATYAIEAGDILIPKLELDIPETIYGVRPKSIRQGQIIAIHEGMLQTGKYQNIFINLGKQDGVVPWEVYDIFRMSYRKDFLPEKTHTLKRKYKNPDLKFSANHYGTVMIYKVFDKLSVGIVMESKFSMAIMDVVSSGKTFCEECPVTNDDKCCNSK